MIAVTGPLDSLGSFAGSSSLSRWSNRLLLIGLSLFALSVPHSIAAAHVSLNICLLAWIVRDVASRRPHFARTAFDLPLLLFAGLTVLSAIFSEAPELSTRKLLTLLLLGVIYLVGSNLSFRGVRWVLALLVVSSLAGATFSIYEKAFGRGLVVESVAANSPLLQTDFRSGDVIWMIARTRVSSLDQIGRIVRSRPTGEKVEIEAIHEGDPLPVTLEVTEAMRLQPNPLGITTGGSSSRFRASGFSRHFLTFAEQMQIMALLSFGVLLAASRRRRVVWVTIFIVFSLALLLTASRGVTVSFLMAIVVTAVLSGRRRAFVGTLIVALVLGGVAIAVVSSSRDMDVARLLDDSSSRRLGYMKAGLRLIPVHPLLGVGMDAHKAHWREWGFPGDYVTHTHSTPIQIALDRGLPALACLVWLFVGMFRWIWRRALESRQESDIGARTRAGLALGTLGALAGFSASALVNYNFGDSEVLLLLLGLVGLVVAAFPKDTKSNRVPREAS
ncbi:MAG: O-antigen ligase family protein [Acidobacteriota bacterium]